MSEQAAGVAIVTGGASGIGLAFARAYAAKGAHVVIGDIDEPAMEQARVQLSESGAAVECVRVDLQDVRSVARLGEFSSGLGPLRAVCLNAGVTSTGSTVWETDEATYDFVIGVNLRGLFHSIKTFVPVLVEQGEAADLVITASMAGMVASPFSGAYAASKAGAIAMAKSLRAELGLVAPSIRVALLNPGMVKTNLIRTSVALLPRGTSILDHVQGMHDALNQGGVEPDEAVAWALRALDENRFWALPVAGDPFAAMLDAELAELREAGS
ncbi:SDR family NAD(P)-dependent oxidoreductase [Mycobacterium sp.]|uniref:SDR family NAD(P)-dependent oxidoreductase n=1 Tax=Mycobacterium sp. TaxID=1785 RepID=UPI002DB31880|nr:SDR family NAD(P)-dependent oxidoreductase [Mycobacterium sp.]